MQFSTFFKIKQYQLFPVISMHVEKQCSSPLRGDTNTVGLHAHSKLVLFAGVILAFGGFTALWALYNAPLS